MQISRYALLTVVLCGVLLLAHNSEASSEPGFPHAPPESVGLDSQKLHLLDAEISEWQREGNFVGGELLIIKRGKAVLHKAYGWADREARRPAELGSIWSIKSMSKPVTTTALMMLVDEEALSLDDKLSKFIPEYVGDPRTTIGHLLSHTSGYRKDDVDDPGPEHKTLEDWVMAWATTPPNGTFGEYEYTDFGFAAAGYIVELVSGLTIDEFTKTRILEPLDLRDTSTRFLDDPDWRDRLNAWYRWELSTDNFHLRWRTDREPWQFYPAAWGMFSTAVDYAEFMSLFMHGGTWGDKRLLKSSTVETMLRPHGFLGDEPQYGYGWFVQPGADGSSPVAFSHGGGDGTYAVAYPNDELIVIFMTHSRYGAQDTMLNDQLSLLGIVDAPPDPGMVRAQDVEEVADAPLPVSARGHVGVYKGSFGQSPLYVVIRVEHAGTHLVVGMSPYMQSYGRRRDLAFRQEGTFTPGIKTSDGWVWLSNVEEFRFFQDSEEGASLEIVADGERIFRARRVDEDALEAELERHRAKTPIDQVIARAILEDGVDAARELSRELHLNRPETVSFHENMLIWLGRAYMVDGNHEVATAIFDMNVESYPDFPVVFDRAARAWRHSGNLLKAKAYLEKAVNLAREQDHPDLSYMESRLEAVASEIGRANE